jgi:deoxyribose-phosphate aldolase
VILQTPLLSDDQEAAAAMLCASCGVSCVEPIHGFGKFSPDGEIIYPDKIDPNDVKKLKDIVGDKIGVKATGSISRLIQALVLIDKGAERVTIPNPLDLLSQYDDLLERTLKYTK